MYPFTGAIYTKMQEKDLLRNIKDEIIEVFKSNHLQAYEKEYGRLGGRFTRK